MKISIIVPILNEAAQIPDRIPYWQKLQSDGADLIVVDGGSRDESFALVQASLIPVVKGPPGRARQMNFGAARSQSDILLFLHADTDLPKDALNILQKSFEKSTRIWGRFDVRVSAPGPMFPILSTMINIRSRLSGIATGDQCIFVKRNVFEALGGFPDQPLMEDIELSKRLLNVSRPICISSRALTSGRRWQTYGIWKTIFLMWRLRWLYWRGYSAVDLAKEYR